MQYLFCIHKYNKYLHLLSTPYYFFAVFSGVLKAHDADWINKTIKKKRIWPDSVISLHSEINENDNDLIPFILETKHDPRA